MIDRRPKVPKAYKELFEYSRLSMKFFYDFEDSIDNDVKERLKQYEKKSKVKTVW